MKGSLMKIYLEVMQRVIEEVLGDGEAALLVLPNSPIGVSDPLRVPNGGIVITDLLDVHGENDSLIKYLGNEFLLIVANLRTEEDREILKRILEVRQTLGIYTEPLVLTVVGTNFEEIQECVGDGSVHISGVWSD